MANFLCLSYFQQSKIYLRKWYIFAQSAMIGLSVSYSILNISVATEHIKLLVNITLTQIKIFLNSRLLYIYIDKWNCLNEYLNLKNALIHKIKYMKH